MSKLIGALIGDNCSRTIDMCFESMEDCDKIVFVWGMEDALTEEKLHEWQKKLGDKLIVINNLFDQVDLKMNGKARNVYLEYVKKEFPNEWCLVCDPDEVVQDLSKIKEFIQTAKSGLYSVKMRHLIQDLSHEDTTFKTHYVLNRLFKIKDASYYPTVEHPVLQPKVKQDKRQTDCTTIWHLAYIPNLWEIKKRYENHLAKSDMHNPEYLRSWYFAHLFGAYPTKRFNPVELPSIILNEFGIVKDELYFANRLLEAKHFMDAIHWKEFFKCKTVIEWGCGRGPRVYAMENIGIKVKGIELSDYAVKIKFSENVVQGDVLDYNELGNFDLSIAYDLLEHIAYEDLDKAINTVITFSDKYILVSVPVIGDPNLENDPTHIIKETKDWWIQKFTDKQLKLIETPKHFLFRDQVLIFEK